MHVKKWVHTIEKCLAASDLVTARRLVEENMGELQAHPHLLTRQIRDLVDVLHAMMETDIQPLNRHEMNQIQYINSYASAFNVRGLKLSVEENPALFARADIHHYLNSDAKTLLEGMSAI